MSRHHNCPHPDRGRSRYRLRLSRRGLSGSNVRMTPVDDLRKTQEARKRNTGQPWPAARGESDDS